ncbi:uncharacterized protein PSFLO_00500 [Pseudozyma flocculosa]|uniref:G-patch domain-containing protein n=1 Tax=Pseudozyma flocculosa TaxID=84751 RepID=A0A5C3EV73_9BASI|nr:uncharacterized protein PSFLO_00500 [Pseudozyma flocculosa]
MASKPRFDPRSILDDLQAPSDPASQQHATKDSGEQEDDDEDDFMSDKFLVASTSVTPAETYSERRRKHLARASDRSRPSASSTRKSLREREEEARREGLDRDLLAEAEIVAGAGEDALPPLDRHGRRMWETLDAEGSGPFENMTEDGLPSAGKGRSAAMKMMLAMGYKRGMALGRQAADEDTLEEHEEQEEDEDEDEDEEDGESQADAAAGAEGDMLHARRGADSMSDGDDEDAEEMAKHKAQDDQAQDDDYLSGGVSTTRMGASIAGAGTGLASASSPQHVSAPQSKRIKVAETSSAALTEPLRIDDRWLSARTRHGIGMVPRASLSTAQAPSSVSSAIAAAASASSAAAASDAMPSAEQQMEDFRSRVSIEHRQRHIEGLLSRSRKTLQELDRAHGVLYNPIWLDANLWAILTGRSDVSMAPGQLTERIERDPATREAVELLEFAFGGEADLAELEREGQEVEPEVKAKASARKEEAQAFCMLDVSPDPGFGLCI